MGKVLNCENKTKSNKNNMYISGRHGGKGPLGCRGRGRGAVCCADPPAPPISDGGLPGALQVQGPSTHPVCTAEGGAHARSQVPKETGFYKRLPTSIR